MGKEMNYGEESLRLHSQWQGKIEVVAAVPVSNKEDLSLAYTPGVLSPVLKYRRIPRGPMILPGAITCVQ